MRMRYRYMTYRYIDGSKQLEQHYRQLLDALRQSQQAILHRSTTWRPPTDIVESPQLVTVKIEVAGMKEEDIEVTLYEDALVINGERRDDHDALEGIYYHEAQIRYGLFRVEVFIPSPIDRNAVAARYENGMLSVDLPKLPEGQPGKTRLQPDEIKQ